LDLVVAGSDAHQEPAKHHGETDHHPERIGIEEAALDTAYHAGDEGIIETGVVNLSANSIGFLACVVRRVQSGFLYSYAFWMVIGLAVMLGWFVTRA